MIYKRGIYRVFPGSLRIASSDAAPPLLRYISGKLFIVTRGGMVVGSRGPPNRPNPTAGESGGPTLGNGAEFSGKGENARGAFA